MSAGGPSDLRRFATTAAKIVEAAHLDRLRDTAVGARLFEQSYWYYKAHVEAADARTLMTLVPPGTVAIDVGANLGFFTRLFVERSPCSLVVAVEPESRNVATLRRGVQRWGRGRVVVFDGAASDITGTVGLRVDARNHADHQLADDGEPVRSVRLDDLAIQMQLSDVGVIKVDVQGAEQRVLLGALALIRRDRPILFVELDPIRLRSHGSDPGALLSLIENEGYALQQIVRETGVRRYRDELMRLAEDAGYVDVLGVPDP